MINKLIRFIEGVKHSEDLGHARWRLFWPDPFRSALFTPQAMEMVKTNASQHIIDLYKRAGRRQPVNRNLYVDVKSYLVDNCLVKMDRMSMAVSLEARVPFLDKELVGLAFQIPDQLKVENGKTKILLKQIAARYVPKDCVYRPKEGFSIPIKNWMLTELRPLLEHFLDSERLRKQGLFRPKTVSDLIRNHMAGTANNSHILWSLMVFQAWHDRWLKKPVR